MSQEAFYSAEELAAINSAAADGIGAETPEGDAKLRAHLDSAMAAYKAKYVDYFSSNNKRVGGIKTMLDTLPRVLLLENFGLFTAGKSAKDCRIAADIYEHTVPAILSSKASDVDDATYEPVSLEDLFDCEYWSLEQAKLKLGKKGGSKKLAGRVAYITGGCSGIGKGTAALMAAEGACVCCVDMNAERVAETEAEFSKLFGADNVMACAVNVCKPEEIQRSFSQVVRRWGGIDIVVRWVMVLHLPFASTPSLSPLSLSPLLTPPPPTSARPAATPASSSRPRQAWRRAQLRNCRSLLLSTSGVTRTCRARRCASWLRRRA